MEIKTSPERGFLGYKLNKEYYEKAVAKMEYTERYLQFLKIGGCKNHEYIMFISHMKNLYQGDKPTIYDHEDFTCFIKDTVKDWLSRYNGHHRTIKVFLYDEFIYQQCQHCRHLHFYQTKGGCRTYCDREMHKVTNGKKSCNNFEWM